MPDSDTGSVAVVEDFLRRRASDLTCYEHSLVLGIDRVGVEIELENLSELGFGRTSRRLVYWDAVTDGSLRNNGVEFITKGDGVGGDVLYKAAVELDAFLKELRPDPSWRCSTHIHVDVRDFSLAQLKLFTLAYAYFERFLFKESGWQRYKSNFCVPLGVAQEQIETLSDLFQYSDIDQFMIHANQHWSKYTALNLSVVNTFGTFEFRMPQPTYKTMDLIKTSNRFLALKRVAKAWTGDQVGFIEYLSTTDIRLIFQKSVGRNTVFKDEDRSFGFGLARDIIAISALKTKSYALEGPPSQRFEYPLWEDDVDDGDREAPEENDQDGYDENVSW
jgi:hypothetical protein